MSGRIIENHIIKVASNLDRIRVVEIVNDCSTDEEIGERIMEYIRDIEELISKEK